ncbi:MAG: hypothetical protein IJH75_03295 [Mogibacterium sp.]|nr:hypothetical protein [Mogibacterium sp.]
MNMEVFVVGAEEFASAIARPAGEATMENYKGYMHRMLEDAAMKQMETVCFQSLELDARTSVNFQNISWIEQAIREHQQVSEYPKTVCIVCSDEKTADQYRVVYNFYFAESKASRLNDGKWD